MLNRAIQKCLEFILTLRCISCAQSVKKKKKWFKSLTIDKVIPNQAKQGETNLLNNGVKAVFYFLFYWTHRRRHSEQAAEISWFSADHAHQKSCDPYIINMNENHLFIIS